MWHVMERIYITFLSDQTFHQVDDKTDTQGSPFIQSYSPPYSFHTSGGLKQLPFKTVILLYSPFVPFSKMTDHMIAYYYIL